MIGWIFLISMIIVEAGMMGYSMIQKRNIKTERAYVRVTEFVIAALCLLPGIVKWTFQVKGMYLVLFLLTVYSIVVLVNKARGIEKGKKYTIGRTIHHTIQMILFFGFAIVPMILFPQHKELETTGEYESKSVAYTWTDESRKETLSGKDEARNVTVEIYYPDQYKDETGIGAEEKFPLIVFSHGAFGYIKSNYSLYKELASNGYIVCSISHTYHAFFTEETSGTMKFVNRQFMQQALDATNGQYGPEEELELGKQWLSVRTGDMNLVIDKIKEMAQQPQNEPAFRHLDTEQIGLIGHSLGGAASVEIARERDDIDTAIVLDGTHLGERTDVVNGKEIYREDPFNISILDLRNEQFSEDIKQLDYLYVNDNTIELSPEGRAITIMGTGHMNFTDLPMFSPMLAKMLGTGDCDPIACTKQIDSIVLQWFNYYLKGASSLSLQDSYEIQ